MLGDRADEDSRRVVAAGDATGEGEASGGVRSGRQRGR